MIVDAITSSITTITDTTGSAQTRQTSSFTLPNNCFIVLPIADYNINHVSGDAVYTINGGSEVSFGAPILTQGATNDKIAFFVTRVVTGGTCIIKLKNCSYDFCPPIVLTGKAHYKVSFTTAVESTTITETPPSSGLFPIATNGLAPVWNTEIPANVTPVHSSKVAIAVMTHGPDSGVPVITPGGTWTTRDSAADYNGAFQPGTVIYKQVASNTAVVGDISIDQSFRHTLTQIIVEDAPEIYLVMGFGSENPTEIEGWFGHNGKGGRDNFGRVIFDPPVPANYGVVPGISVFGGNPTLDMFSDTGGNTWTIKKQESYNGGGGDGNGASLTALISTLTSPMDRFDYDASGKPDADNFKYGQIWAYVFEQPDTVNGFQTITPISNSQLSASTLSPGSSNPVRNKTFWMFFGNNRGHTENLKPYVKPTGYSIAKLIHSEIDGDGAESAVHDSITQAGWTFGKYVTTNTTETPEMGFATGTAEGRTLLIGVNLLGGTSFNQDQSWTGTGGIAFGGSVTPVKGKIASPSGGVVYSGSVIAVRGRSVTPSNGVNFSDAAASIIRGRVAAPSGGMVFSGAGTFVRTINTPAPTGGVVFGGVAAALRERFVSPLGGMVFAASVVVLQGRVVSPTAGVVFAGAATVIGDHINNQDLVWTPSGGFILAGAASVLRERVVIPVSGVIFSTSVATVLRERVVVPIGGYAYAGTVTALRGKVVIPVGGFLIEASIVPLRGRVVMPSGGVIYAGAADVGSGELVHWIPMGGIEFGGSVLGLRGKVHHVSGGWVWGGAATVEALSAGQSPIDATLDARVNYGLIIHRVRRKV